MTTMTMMMMMMTGNSRHKFAVVRLFNPSARACKKHVDMFTWSEPITYDECC